MSLGLSHTHASAIQDPDRPWVPIQLLGVATLFGAGAVGVVAGINYARLGKRQYVIPTILAGVVLFLLHAGAFLFLLPDLPPQAALVFNLLIGAGFMLAQKPTFEAWKAQYWTPTTPGAAYQPNRIGRLFVVGLACAAVEVGIVLLMVLLVPAR